MQVYKSWRDSPKAPPGWTPKHPPGAVVKVKLKNKALLKQLQAVKPGRWYKVYHYGKDGSSIHYCQHASGDVFDVEHHR
jgi:hypothetical protein